MHRYGFFFWGVMFGVCQRASSFHKYTRAHTCIYFRKLLARWYAGTLLTFYSLSTHSPMPTQNSTIIKICPSPTFPCIFAGLPRVYRGSNANQTSPRNVRLLRFPFFSLPIKTVARLIPVQYKNNRDCHFGSLYPYISATLRRITS